MAVLCITLGSGNHDLECACHSETEQVQVMCEWEEQERLPAQIATAFTPVLKPEPAYELPPPEALSDLALDTKHPPPKRG